MFIRAPRTAAPATSPPVETVRPVPSAGRDVGWTYWALIIGAFLIATCVGIGNTWDGAYLMFKALNDRTPYVPHGRIAEVILQWPVVWLAHFTSNMTVLRVTYTAPYAIVPVIALLICWWIARDKPYSMFVWPAIGIALVTLPGQINLAAEANIPAQLFWPVLLAIIVGVNRRQLLAVVICCLFILTSHPFAVLMFGCGTAAALLFLYIRRRFSLDDLALPLIVAAFFLLSVIKYVILRSAYDDDQVSPSIWSQHFSQGVAGKPLVMLLIVFVIAAIILALPYASGKSTALARLRGYARPLALAGCGVLLLIGVSWALDYRAWGGASDYRTFIGPIAALAMLLAVLDGVGLQTGRAIASRLDLELRRGIIYASAVVFIAVFAVQVVTWSNLTDRLKGEVAQSASACVPVTALHWTAATAFGHWSVTPLSLLLQGRTPTRVVVTTPDCAQAGLQAGVPVSTFDRITYSGGWFTLGRLRGAIVQAANVGAASLNASSAPH